MNWISVKDYLPKSEHGETREVLAVANNGLMFVLECVGKVWHYLNGEPFEWETSDNKIAYWMPMPKTPDDIEYLYDVEMIKM